MIILTYLNQTTFLILLATLTLIPSPDYLLFLTIKSLLARPEDITALQALLLSLTGTVHSSLSLLTLILLLSLLLLSVLDAILTLIQSLTNVPFLFLQIWLLNYFRSEERRVG